MATYLGIAVYVGMTGSLTSDVNNWSNRQPTYITYTGNSTARSLSSGIWIPSLYTDYDGKKYAIWIIDINNSSAAWVGQYLVQNIGTSWCHNDTASYACPSDYSVNVDHKKDVYPYYSDTPFTNISLYGYTIQCAWKYNSYWNEWKSNGSSYTSVIHNKVQTPNALSNEISNKSTAGTIIVSASNSTGTYGNACRVAIVRNNLSSYPNTTRGVSNGYVYDFSTHSNNNYNETTSTYPAKRFAIHNVSKTNYGYYVGYFGAPNSGITTNPTTGSYNYSYGGYNQWVKNGNYFSITVDTKSQLCVQEIPVQLGKTYQFNMYTNSRQYYDGVVITKVSIDTQIVTNQLTAILPTNQIICSCSGSKMTSTTTGSYTPTEDGTIYLYYRTSNKGLQAPSGTTCTTSIGGVEMIVTNASAVTVTLDKNEGTGGTNSVSIAPGTAAANYPSITLPTRSGYIFQGYFDDSTGGTAYYNAAGQGTRVFNKVSATTLYAHWQQENLPTITVTLNKNGGSGGQDTASVVSGQMVGTVTVPSRDGFKFLGYYNKYNTAPGGSGQYQYVDETGTGCKTISSNITLYALWQNTISYELLYSVQNPKVVTYSTSSQMITVSDGGWTCPGGTMSNIQYTFGGGGTVSSPDGGLSFEIPSKDVATYTLSVTLTSPTSAVANGYFGTTKTYSFGVRYIQKNIEFHLLGQEVYSPNTAQAKVRAEVAGTLYWGTSSSSMTSTQSISAGLSSWTPITSATQTSVGTKTIYGYFVPSSNNYNWVGGVDNPGDSVVLKVLAAATTVTITLDDNGGSGGSGSIVVQKDSTCSTWPSVSVPTRAGFTFMGYFTVNTATGGSQVYYASGSPYYGYSTSSNVTIYARWKVVITYPHYNKTSETATEAFVSTQPGEATSTSSAVTMQINGQINCVISSRTVSVTTSGKTNWTINSTGTTLTIPSGTSYSSGSLNWQIVVADGTYNGYPYVGNTVTQQYSWYDDYDERPSLYYNLKKVEYEKENSYTPVKYKDMNGTLGYNVTNAAIPGDGNTIYGPYYYAYTTDESMRYISNTITNNISWYQRYTNGTWDTTLKTGTEDVYGVWRIISETFTPSSGGTAQNITRSHATDTALASQLLINGNYYTVYRARSADYCYVHDSMEKNLGTDNMVVRIYNPSDPTKYTDITNSVTNSLSTTQYTTSECTTQGYASLTPSNPTVTIGDGLTAAGGSGTITCVCNDTASWYQKYTSKAYEYYSNQSVTSPAWWRMTSQTCAGGTNRFSTPTVYSWNSTTLNIGGTDYTCYKTGYDVSHSSMTSNVGNDVVVITAYREDDTTKVGTATKSISNILEPTHYSNSNCTIVGNKSSSYGTPSTVTIGDGLTAAGGSASVTGGTCTDTFTYYQKYTSGTKKSAITTETVDSTITWSLSTSTFTPSGGSASNTDRFTLSGMTVNHTTMGTNAGTDKVVVRATNANATSKYKDSSAKSITNSLGTTKYKNTSGTQGYYSQTYGTPSSLTIGTISAGAGTSTLGCTCTNTFKYYLKYTSGSYSGLQTETPTATITWSITSQTFTPSGGSASAITRFSVSGSTLSHTTMGTNVGTDSVTVKATNAGDTSKTATKSGSVTNGMTISLVAGTNTVNHGGTTSGTVTANWNSGSSQDVTSSSTITYGTAGKAYFYRNRSVQAIIVDEFPEDKVADGGGYKTYLYNYSYNPYEEEHIFYYSGTINYSNSTKYVWQTNSDAAGVKYVVTETNDAETLLGYSMSANLNNAYADSIVAVLNEDQEDYGPVTRYEIVDVMFN